MNGVDMRMLLSAQCLKHKSHILLYLHNTLQLAKLNLGVHLRRADVPCLVSSCITMLAPYLACTISAEIFC